MAHLIDPALAIVVQERDRQKQAEGTRLADPHSLAESGSVFSTKGAVSFEVK